MTKYFESHLDAWRWAYDSGMAFTKEGYLVTSGCEGCGPVVWAQILEAAEWIAEKAFAAQSPPTGE